MERIATGMATGELATGLPTTLPMARTDGRTNGRANHLNEIPSVLNRARFFQSDIDLAVFLATRKPTRVRHEKYRPRAPERLVHEYDLETTNQLSFIHGQQAVQAETRNAS